MTLMSWKYFALVLVALLLVPVTSRADVNYTFISLDCNAKSKSATIKTFYDWNEVGKDRVSRHEKNVYYLNDIAKIPQQKVTCDLGNGNILSFIARHDEAHMANDHIDIDINRVNVPNRLLQYPFGQAEMTVTLLASHEINTRTCQLPSNKNTSKSKCEINISKME